MKMKGHSNSVQSAVFSPDGAHIVSGSVNKTADLGCDNGRQGDEDGGAQFLSSVRGILAGRCTRSVWLR